MPMTIHLRIVFICFVKVKYNCMFIPSNDKNTRDLKMSNRANCWNYMRCGREPGGDRASEFGICPAALAEELDGFNGGQNGGRFCWAIAGTFCGGKVQGTFGQKYGNCKTCDFYNTVQSEENSGFQLSPSLLARLR